MKTESILAEIAQMLADYMRADQWGKTEKIAFNYAERLELLIEELKEKGK